MYDAEHPPPSIDAARTRRNRVVSLITDLRETLTQNQWLDADGRPLPPDDRTILRDKVRDEYTRLVKESTYLRALLKDPKFEVEKTTIVGALLDVIEDLRDAGATITDAHAATLDNVAAWLEKRGWKPGSEPRR